MRLNLNELLKNARIEYWEEEDILCIAFGKAMTSNIGDWLLGGNEEVPPIGIVTELDDETPVALWIFGWKRYWEKNVEKLPLPVRKKVEKWKNT